MEPCLMVTRHWALHVLLTLRHQLRRDGVLGTQLQVKGETTENIAADQTQ